MSREDIAEGTEQFTQYILRAPTFEISVFAALAILGLVAYVTAHIGMTPEQADVWSAHVASSTPGYYVTEFAVRPAYWRLQALAGETLFMVAAFGEAAHHLAESAKRKEN